jgi:hypothetical protein
MKRYAVVAVQEARDLLVAGKWSLAFRELLYAARLGLSREYWREFFSFIRLGLRVAFVSLKNSFFQ